MARRSDHSREELTGLALGAARRIVQNEGLRALGTRRVAREIGYTVGTIYNHFENLDDLVDHLNGETLDQLHQVCSRIAPGASPVERLRKMAESYIGFAAKNPKLYVTIFEHQHPAGTRPPDWYYEKVAALLDMVESTIAPIMPDASPAQIKAQARVLWSGVHGIISLEGAENIAGSPQAGALVDLLIDNFLAGVR